MPVKLIEGHSNFFDVGFEVYGHKVSIMFCDDVKLAIAEYHPNAEEQIDAEALTYFYNSQAACELYLKFNAAPGSIAHEAFHAVWNMFKYHSVEPDDENIAYHLGYLVNEITRAQKEAQKAKETYARNKKLKSSR